MGSGYRIVLPASRVATAKSDERLGPAFALARAANAITLARGPLLVPLEDPSPSASRERFSALFYVAGVLFEALRTSEEVAKHFDDLDVWKKGFGALLADPDVRQFRGSTLRRFRDKGTFHFDAGFFRRAASRWPSNDIILAHLTSTRVGDIYMSVPDDLLFSHILGPFENDEAVVAAFDAFSTATIHLMGRFLEAAHDLIPAVLSSLGADARPAV